MQTVKIGWIGLGHHTQSVLYRTLDGLPARVVAVCDTDADRARAFAAAHGVPAFYADYREMARNETLDAIVCAVSSKVHGQVAAHFAALGTPVFIEKTPCDTMAEAEAIAALERKTGALVMTGFNRRFATGYAMAKRIIDSPEFGGATLFSSKFHASPYRDRRFFLTNHLIHHLDLARFLVGELSELRLRAIQIDAQRVGFQLSAVAGERALVTIESSSLQDIRYPMERVEVTGVGRFVQVDNMRSLAYHRPAGDTGRFEDARMDAATDALVWQPNLGFPFANSGLGNEDEMRHFIDCVRGAASPALTFQDTVRTMVLLDEVLRLDDALNTGIIG